VNSSIKRATFALRLNWVQSGSNGWLDALNGYLEVDENGELVFAEVHYGDRALPIPRPRARIEKGRIHATLLPAKFVRNEKQPRQDPDYSFPQFLRFRKSTVFHMLELRLS
jgi:hypothetical protein